MPGELGGLLILLILIDILIMTVSILLASKLFTMMSGGPGSADAQPEASFGKSLGISVILFVIKIVLGILIVMMMAEGAMRGGGFVMTGFGTVQIIVHGLTVLILAALLCPFLPTSFGRALLTSLLYIVIYIALSFVIGLLLGMILARGL